MNIAIQVVKGPHKLECEDNSLIYCPENNQAQIFNECRQAFPISETAIIAVADGVGGNPGGAKASHYAQEMLLQRASKILKGELLDKELLPAINEELDNYAKTQAGLERMATTFSCLKLKDKAIGFVHTGNSRISVLKNIYIQQLTHDFTTYQYLEDRGDYEAAENCNRSEITSCLGGGSTRNLTGIDIKAIQVMSSFNYLILTSDGIHEYVDTGFMEDVLARDDIDNLTKTDLMIEEALKNNSEDDKTVILLDMRKAG